jgi:tetratricopeptide (TPR) repeat protein
MRLVGSVGLWLCLAVGVTLGQEPVGMVGRRVVLPFDAVLRVNGIVADDQKVEARARGGLRNIHRVYRIEQVDGLWVLLQAEASPARGWVEAAMVIPQEQAIDYYTQRIVAYPANAAGYLSRGMVWSERGEYDRALVDFDEALKLDPANEIAWSNRGLAWSSKKEYDKAIADYTEAIKIDSQFALAYYDRALAWYQKKDYDKSIADNTQAIKIDPKYATAFCNRGFAHYKKKNYTRANADFREAIRFDPRCSTAYDGKGKVWLEQKEYDNALKNFDSAIKLDRARADFYIDRGQAWAGKGAYDKALGECAVALRIDTRCARAYAARAWIWATCRDEKYRDGKKAVESALRACELSGGKEVECLDALAAAYAEAGEFGLAVRWGTTVVGMVPGGEGDEYRKRLEGYRAGRVYREGQGSVGR